MEITSEAPSKLLINRAVTNNSKFRRIKLSPALIDYRKAYDSMPHTWIWVHNTKNRHQELHVAVENNSGSQQVPATVAQVNIKYGIYQGDSLSPLLFCIGLNSLSQIITKSGYGYKFKSGATISHLLYMDDIKLYAKNERDIDSLIHLTRIYSEDIGMSFGLEVWPDDS